MGHADYPHGVKRTCDSTGCREWGVAVAVFERDVGGPLKAVLCQRCLDALGQVAHERHIPVEDRRG